MVVIEDNTDKENVFIERDKKSYTHWTDKPVEHLTKTIDQDILKQMGFQPKVVTKNKN